MQSSGLGLAFQDLGVSQHYGYLLGVPIIRAIVYWGLYWGPPIEGNYHLQAAWPWGMTRSWLLTALGFI